MQQALLLLAAAAAAASRMWPQPHAADAPVAVGDETPRGASAVPTLLPPAGPTDGGTSVTLHAREIPSCNASAVSCECTFGGQSVPASAGEAKDTARCVSPSSSVGVVDVGLALNGQAHISLAPLPFSYYAPPTVSSTSTQLVPIAGGRPVTIFGSGFGAIGNNAKLLRCGFVSAESTLTRLASTPATRIGEDALRCLAPSAAAALASPAEIRLEFGLRSGRPPTWRAQPAWVALQGAARIETAELVLTRAFRAHTAGSAWLQPRWPHAPLTQFSLRLEILLAGGSGADGLSIRYGPPSGRSASFDEMGREIGRTCAATDGVLANSAEAANASCVEDQGLVVRLRTHLHQRVEALLDGVTFASARVDPLLRGDSYAPLTLDIDAQLRLTLRYRGFALLHDAPMPHEWLAAPQRSWRLGVGAGTGEETADHRARSIRLSSAHLRPRSVARVSVSGNGGVDFSPGGPRVSYVASPLATAFAPRVGPSNGGTRIRVVGPSLCASRQPLTCRWGGQPAVASMAACFSSSSLGTGDGDALPPTRPPPPATPPVNTNLLDRPRAPRWRWPDSASPVAPPLAVEESIVCEAPPASATSNASAAEVAEAMAAYGWSTALAETGRSVSLGSYYGGYASYAGLELSLERGGWQSAPSDPFAYYAPPRWSSGVIPAGGPVRGSTLVELYGGDEARAALSVVAAASATADVACAFGGAIVRATASATGGSLRCTTPPWHTAGAVSVRVSLNGQQFHELVPPTSDGTPPGEMAPDAPLSADSTTFTYYQPAPPVEIVPPQGPTAGGTNVSFRGIGLEGGVGYACKFGYAVVAATYSEADGYVYCASAHAHLALAPPAAGRAALQSYYGGLSLERSADGAVRLTFASPLADEARRFSSNASTEAAVADAARLGAQLAMSGGAAVRGGALRLTDSDGPLQHRMWGQASLRMAMPRPPLLHLSVSFDALLTGPPADSTSAAEYPYGLTLSVGGPEHPTELVAALHEPHGATPASSTGASGVRVLLGYGATRDANFTNESVATYARVVHTPAGGGAVQEFMVWLPHVSLPSASWRRLQLVVYDAELHLWLDDVHLLDGVALDEWKPAVEWGVALHASRRSRYHIHWVDNVQIGAGSLRLYAEVPIKLTRNGQQFDSIGSHTFGYRAPPVVSSIVPHAGAAWDNTTVVLRGANFAGGSDYRCFFDTEQPDVDPADVYAATDIFRRVDRLYEEWSVTAGGVWVAATYNPTNDTVHCVAPPRKGTVPSGVLAMNASVSLNGVDAGVPRHFEYVNASDLMVYPALGPADGGIHVAMRGNALFAGHDRECRFGDGDYRTNASLRTSDNALICATPAASQVAAAADATVDFRLSLNGQDGTFAQVPLRFEFYPNPVISRVHPPAGPSAGGSSVTLYGRGFSGSSPRLQCRFDQRIILAEPNATDEWMVCVTPTAPIAAAAVELTAADCALGGEATREDDPMSELVLTRLGRFDVEGSCLWGGLTPRYASHCGGTPPYPDPIVQTCTAADALYGAVSYFEATFEIYLTDGGEGLTFSYGPVASEAAHAPRVRMGLCVELLTSHNDTRRRVLALTYDDTPLARVAVPPLTHPTEGYFAPLLIAYDRAAHGGAAAGLAVIHDGSSLVRGMTVHDWQPRSSWRFRLSARSGSSHADAIVRRVRIRAGGHVEAQRPPLHMTRNDQDFDPSPAPRPYVYYGIPVVSTIAPASGPALGGSRLLIAGESLLGGSAYHCRFGHVGRYRVGNVGGLVYPPSDARIVLPDVNTSHAAPFVHCVTPPYVAAGVRTPQVALNRQDETDSLVAFRYYDPPALQAVSPSSGPSFGGTLVELHGANFSSAMRQPINGNASRTTDGSSTAPLVVCRFGEPMWPRYHGYLSVLTALDSRTGPHSVGARPTHGLAPNEVYATVLNDTTARCYSPLSVGGAHDDVHVELSLNGHDFTDGGNAPHKFYAEVPRVTTVFPVSDSSAGGRLLTIRGAGLANGSNVICEVRASPALAAVGRRELGVDGLWFATQYIPATALDDNTVVCPSPTLPASSPLNAAEVPVVFPLELRVSLNAQQYTAAAHGEDAAAPLDLGISAGGGGATTPILLAVRPSLGPVSGGTYVRVSGLKLGHGSSYLCRFGASVVNASFEATEGSVSCVTPAHASSTIDLAISFNGEHYEVVTFRYTFHEELLLREVSPASGPAYAVQCDDAMRCPGGGSLGTLVTISGDRLNGGAPPLFPDSAVLDSYRCRFNASVVPATLVSIGGTEHVVKCHAPGPLGAGLVADLRVSLNTQDYSEGRLTFTYQQPELRTAITPALGPAVGGTNVTIRGNGLGGGSHYLCRFGAIVVPAFATTNITAAAETGAQPLNGAFVHCSTPAWSALPATTVAHRLDQHRAPLALSLNGQQFYRTGLYFAYHPAPTLSSVLPAAGPAGGGTLIRLDGSRLDGGDERLFNELWVSQVEDVRTRAELSCRFDAYNGSHSVAVVAATWQAAHERVLCDTPPAAVAISATGADPMVPFPSAVSLSLNGVDFGASTMEYSFLPIPTLASVVPNSGPSLGGTEVTINGLSFDTRLSIACAFGTAIADATILSPSAIRCVTMSLGHATPDAHTGGWYGLGETPLRGGATKMHSAIRLSAIGERVAGSLALPFPRRAPQLLDFDVSWLYMLPREANYAVGYVSDGDEASGSISDADAAFAFRYGPLPEENEAFGGEGAAEGLSVSLSDGPPPLVIEVRYVGTTLISRAVGAPLQRAEWMRVRVQCAAGVLNVSAGERVLVTNLVLPSWRPLRAWDMGIGASGARPGRYVAAVRLRSALMLGLSDAPVRLLLHGVQYTPTELNFTYASEPVVSRILPASGPTSAPTTVVISGANFDLGLSVSCVLRQNSSYSNTVASLYTNMSHSEINCTVPITPPWVTGEIRIFAMLANGASGPGAVFERYTTPTLHYLSPVLGVGASTIVRIYGEWLGAGHDRRCRFGNSEVPAYVQPAGHLECTAPVNSVASTVDVEITLNGEQYVASGNALSFRFLTGGMVFVSSVDPPLGPLRGTSNISVSGTNFVAVPTLACAFGGVVVNATYHTASLVVCDAPAVSSQGAVTVEVSLNRQEYYAGAPFFHTADGAIIRPSPSSKGRSGGGYATAVLSPPLAPEAVALGSFICRFGQAPCGGATPTCVESAATLVSAETMRCAVPHSPLAQNPAVASTDVAVYIALNGRQYSYGPVTFTYFEVDPEMHAIEPPIGPIRGETPVFVRGVGLHAGNVGEHGCRFNIEGGVVGEFVPATPAADESGLRCVAPPKALAAAAAVEITLNAADFVGNATQTFGTFTYTLSGAPSTVNPSSGPRHGGTVLMLSMRPRPERHREATNGIALCRLGNATIPGTFSSMGALRCIAPAGPVGEVPVAVALNGIQWEEGDARYSFVYSLSDLMGDTDPTQVAAPPSPSAPPPNASAVLAALSAPSSNSRLSALPLVGPTAGGTLVNLSAVFSLAVATALRCRFGPSSLAGSDVPATLAAGDVHSASCISPSTLSSLEASAAAYPYDYAVPLSLSLNGQQYASVATFRLYAPAQPLLVTPFVGSTDGGTIVNITGSLLGGGGGSEPRLCSFGETMVQATYVDESGDGSAGMLRCVAASADAAGFRQWFTLDFGREEEIARAASLHGNAAVLVGSLRLIDNELNEFGVFKRRCGALVLEPLTGAREVPYFEVRFDLLCTGATDTPGGAGVSFNYGPIIDGSMLDERGSGHSGLAISLRGGVANVVEVRLDGRLVLAASLSQVMHASVWLPVVIRYAERTHNSPGGLLVRIGESNVIETLRLSPWAPLPSWRLALAGCSADVRESSHEHWVHRLRIGAGSLHNRTSVPIRVSLNGQQFDPTAAVGPPLAMRLLTRPLTSHFTPVIGRVSGGSMLQIFGAHFGHGSTPSCRFGVTIVPATVFATTPEHSGELRCSSPPSGTAAAVALSVSVNGEQFSTPPLHYVYHDDVAVSQVSPSSGPVGGGTAIRLIGSLPGPSDGATHPTCRFIAGAVEVPLHASYDSSGGGSITCVTPPAEQLQLSPPMPQSASLLASLNALDFSAADAVSTFTYVPTYRALSLSPRIGPIDGGTNISVSGTDILSTTFYSELTCRVGLASSSASLIEPGTLRCPSPSLRDAAGIHEHLPSQSWQLRGVAQVHGAGFLLTSTVAHTSGALTMLAANPNLTPERHPAPPAFNVTFQLLITPSASGGGVGDGAGFSVSYGDLDAGVLGEYGGGDGLRVSFRSMVEPPMEPSDVSNANTSAGLGDVISVRLGVVLLREYWLAAHDPPIVAGAYMPVAVEYEESRGLTVTLRGAKIIEGLRLPGWLPQAGSSFGIGARTSAVAAQFAVRQLGVSSGLLLSGGHLGLQVTLNGRDYDYGGVRFHYYSVFRAFPALGPSTGGTVIHLNGTELQRNYSSRTCRFGEVLVGASIVEGTNDLTCVSPVSPNNDVYQQALTVSLNGVDELHVLDFNWYRDPQIWTLVPQQGSSAGGTTVTATGNGIVYSAAPTIRIGSAYVPATFHPGSYESANAVVFVTPPLSAGVDAYVSVSLDGQYYGPETVFGPLDELAAVSVTPSSGSYRGGTSVNVAMRGMQGLWRADQLRCRIGNTTVNGGYAAAGVISCPVPPLDYTDADASTLASLEDALNITSVADANGVRTWPTTPQPVWPGLPRGVDIEVSVNSVDFSVGSAIKFYYLQPMPTPLVTTIVPPMGPTNGYTRVTVRGLEMRGASQPGCRFGTLIVRGTVGGAGADATDSMVCDTPASDGLTGPVYLALSLNGQQWTAATSRFTFATPTAVHALLPDIAPNLGGLVLELSGAHLSGGSDYRCRFGRVRGPLEDEPPTTVEATYDAESDTILCTSPAGLLGYVPLAVSLNAQQYSEGGPVLTVYDPDSMESLILLPGEDSTVAEVQ